MAQAVSCSSAIGVMLSASTSVLTPFKSRCTLVYVPGKYRFSDFLTADGGLRVIALAEILIMVPLSWTLK